MKSVQNPMAGSPSNRLKTPHFLAIYKYKTKENAVPQERSTAYNASNLQL